MVCASSSAQLDAERARAEASRTALEHAFASLETTQHAARQRARATRVAAAESQAALTNEAARSAAARADAQEARASEAAARGRLGELESQMERLKQERRVLKAATKSLRSELETDRERQRERDAQSERERSDTAREHARVVDQATRARGSILDPMMGQRGNVPQTLEEEEWLVAGSLRRDDVTSEGMMMSHGCVPKSTVEWRIAPFRP